MLLQWSSIVLTLTGMFVWFTGANQGLGYGIFMAGGVMWLILQDAEKKKLENAKRDSPVLERPIRSRAQRPPRQSDLNN